MRVVELRSDIEDVVLRSDLGIRNVELMFKFDNSTLGNEVRNHKKKVTDEACRNYYGCEILMVRSVPLVMCRGIVDSSKAWICT